MRCDIHAAIEYKDKGKWTTVLRPNRYFGKYEDEPEFTGRLDLDRDYDMFAILGNVRNGRGFAGVKTSEAFPAISDNRGFPEDAASETIAACDGEHSETWVELFELLSYDWTRNVTHYGVVSAVQFEAWDRMRRWKPAPESYCGSITGTGIVHVPVDEMRIFVKSKFGDKLGKAHKQVVAELEDFNQTQRFYTKISWEETCAESGKQIWTKILPYMLKLRPDVRLVMNFDS